MSNRGAAGRLSLDELIALNDEIAALVRAGVPIERGLAGVGRDFKGRLGRVAERVGRRMEADGCSLAEAVSSEAKDLPELYAAVIEAGSRSGRLTAALEGLTALARMRAELRRSLLLAMIYPLIVLLVAYGLFVALVAGLAPRVGSEFESLGVPTPWAEPLARVADSVFLWGPIGLGVFVILAVVWMRSGRAAALGAGGGRAPGLRFPGVRGLASMARAGVFSEMLALLIEHRVPMPEALDLAARAVGDPGLRSAADRVSEAIRRGDSPDSNPPSGDRGAFPPMLRWLILTGSAQGDLPGALRAAARTYRDRAASRAEVIRFAMPTILLVGVGGGAVLAYGLTLFLPLSAYLRQLG